MIRQSQPDVVRGVAPVSPADAGAGEPLRVSLEQPRLGRDLSRLTAHGPDETPLQHAATKLAGLIAPWYLASNGGSLAERPVSQYGLRDYVRGARDGARCSQDRSRPGAVSG
jgi:hypothetical protein